MPQKIQALIKANREGAIILTAAIITLLLFVYSSFVNLNLAISNLADALIECGILASMFCGWNLCNTRRLTVEPAMIVSSAVVILPLFFSQPKHLLADSIINFIAILMPILLHAIVILAIQFILRLFFGEKRWQSVLAAICTVALIGIVLGIANAAPVYALVLWVVEIIAIRNKCRYRRLTYMIWVAVLWISGLLCYTELSFSWAIYIRRCLFPMSLFLWPFIFCPLIQLVQTYLRRKTNRAALKTAFLGMIVLVALWATNLLFSEYDTEKYRMTHLIYFLVLSDLFIWKETAPKTEKGIDKVFIGCGLLSVNLGSVSFYLFQKVSLMKKLAVSSPSGIPNISYWIRYRLEAILASVTHNYAALENTHSQEFYRYAEPILNEGRLASAAYHHSFLLIVIILLLLIFLALLLRHWNCESPWMKCCVQYASYGYVLRALLAVASDIALLAYDYVPFPFSGRGAAELLFLILIISFSSWQNALSHIIVQSSQENSAEKLGS